ncbi:MAG: hypothetical protein J6N15_10485 [Ruminiclostridium sp.]|nr:hypothetical protein [Ruminiclostridium sp.]
MSVKRKDDKNRWRNKTIAFRVSPEENDLINTQVALSGLSKQDYILKRLLCKDIVVQPNPRVYKALKDKLDEVLTELRRIGDNGADDDLLETIKLINETLYGMK